MFHNRVDEIKAITGKDLVALTDDPEVIVIDDFLSPLDITYLLDTGKSLTESISEQDVERYRLSPYCHDFIRLISYKISQVVDKNLNNLNYINLYNMKKGQSLVVKGFNLPKIQESTKATSPNGKIEAIGVIALSNAHLSVCNVPVPTQPGSLIVAKTVDVDPKTCNNTTVASSTLDEDVWFCAFKFAEHPRELNEVIL